MVAVGIAEAAARWTGPLLAVERKSKAVSGHHDELLRPQVQLKSSAGHHVQPVTCMVERKGLEPCHLLIVSRINPLQPLPLLLFVHLHPKLPLGHAHQLHLSHVLTHCDCHVRSVVSVVQSTKENFGRDRQHLRSTNLPSQLYLKLKLKAQAKMRRARALPFFFFLFFCIDCR